MDTLRTERTTRTSSILGWAVSAARSLKDAFDDYVNKEIQGMREVLTLLSSVGQEVDDERTELKNLERRYLVTNDSLNNIIDAANRQKIKRIEFSKPAHGYDLPDLPKIQQEERREVDELDIGIILEAFGIVGEAEKMRSKIDRLSRNYMNGINDIEGVLEALLRKRGLAGTP